MVETSERQFSSKPGTLEGIDPKHLQRYEWAQCFTRGRTVYDIACGTGYGSLLLQAEKLVGFDSSRETVEYANKYHGELAQFVVADACKMPNLPKAEIIVSFETIEHLEKPEAFLQWCSEHCELLLVSSPISGSFKRSRWHLFEYSLEEFRSVLQKYFSHQVLFVQRDGLISYPGEGLGVAIGVCW